MAVAFHATAWPELLAGLAHDELAAVRWAVARNSATPFDVQCELLDDHDPSSRVALAAWSRWGEILTLLEHLSPG
ncbi:MAG TPA: hypothetical protein VN886_08315 [Acidimicrobiales bacterium]|nr:hypothetical protein [Acidimicrobiales bacterium]